MNIGLWPVGTRVRHKEDKRIEGAITAHINAGDRRDVALQGNRYEVYSNKRKLGGYWSIPQSSLEIVTPRKK